MEAKPEKHKEPLNVVALGLLLIGAPLVLVGAWQLGFSLMLIGLAAAIAAYIRYRDRQQRA